MSDIRELYQEVILHHSKSPRNFGSLDDANRHAEGHNPLCGDQLTLGLIVEDGTVREVRFQGEGCAISTASASVMTDLVRGKSEQEVRALSDAFLELITGDAEPDLDALGKLAVFAGVREFPVRVKCATLAWRTLEAALQNDGQAVTTE